MTTVLPIQPTAEPIFTICAAHGRYQSGERVGSAERYGLRCPACWREYRIEAAQLPSRLAAARLEDYVVECDGQRRALEAATDFAEHFQRYHAAGHSSIFMGLPGTGKTHLCSAIARRLLERDIAIRYVTMADMIAAVRSSWARGAERCEDEVLEDFTRPALLIVDEVGMQHGSESERVIASRVFGPRYDAMLPSLVLTNEDADGLRRYLGDRVVDRLCHGGANVVPFDWPSYRPRAK